MGTSGKTRELLIDVTTNQNPTQQPDEEGAVSNKGASVLGEFRAGQEAQLMLLNCGVGEYS